MSAMSPHEAVPPDRVDEGSWATPRRRVLRLVALAGLAGACVSATLVALELEPDVPLVLLVALAVGSVVAELLMARTDQTGWETGRDLPTVAPGLDARTSAHVRVLEDHHTARHPDPALRERLRALAEQTLAVRHGAGVGNPRARLGPRLRAVLDGPPRRLGHAEIDACLDEIEGL